MVLERRVTSHTEEEEMNQRRHLLALARKGDQKAVGKLMELYQVRVYSGENLRMVRPSRALAAPSKPKPSKMSLQKSHVTPQPQTPTSGSKQKVDGRKGIAKPRVEVKKSFATARAKKSSGVKVTKTPAQKTKPTRTRSAVKSHVTRVSGIKGVHKVKVSSKSKLPSKSRTVGKSKSVTKKPTISRARTLSKAKTGSRAKTMSKAKKNKSASKSKVFPKRKGR